MCSSKQPTKIIKTNIFLGLKVAETSARLVSYYPYSKAGETVPFSVIVSGISIYLQRNLAGVGRIDIIYPHVDNDMHSTFVDPCHTDKVLFVPVVYVFIAVVGSTAKLGPFSDDGVVGI